MKKILLFLYMLGCLLMYSLEGKSQVYNFGEDYYSPMFTQDMPSWTTIEQNSVLDPFYLLSPTMLYSYNHSLFIMEDSSFDFNNDPNDVNIGLGELEEILVPITDDVQTVFLLLITYFVFIGFRSKRIILK